MNTNPREISSEQCEEIIGALKARFEKNMNRHPGLEWAKVQAKLEADPEKLWSLSEMERTGGEPDVVGQDDRTGEYRFLRLYGGKPCRPQEFVLRPPGVGCQERK